MQLVIIGVLVVLVLALFATRRRGAVEKFEGLRVGITAHGRGIFATKAFKKGEVIDVCPVLIAPNEDWGEAVQEYLFAHTAKQSALALGSCSLFNHSSEPNADRHYEPRTHSLVFTALRDISPGEELRIDYGHNNFTR